jgi:hypothetical protein
MEEEFMELPQVPQESEGCVERQSAYRYELAGYYVDMNREDYTFEHVQRTLKRNRGV